MGAGPRRSIRVLVVDDEPDVVEFVSEVIRSAGCETRTADNGDQALVEASSFRPHLVFLDIIIPEQDGWLVCSKLKMLKPAPMIALITGMRDGDDDRFADFVHADRLLHKPFAEEDVLSVLAELPPPQ